MSASWVFVALSRVTWVTPDIVSCASAVLGSLNMEENVSWKVLLDHELEVWDHKEKEETHSEEVKEGTVIAVAEEYLNDN